MTAEYNCISWASKIWMHGIMTVSFYCLCNYLNFITILSFFVTYIFIINIIILPMISADNF